MFLAVFPGADLSDLICYWVMGRYLGNKIFKIKFFANFLNKKRLDHIHHYYENYGILTLFLGRFIPFGVRNGLFFTAGLSKMNAWKFSIIDFFASLISCSLFFTLYFNYGELAINYIRKANTFFVVIFIIVSIAFYLYV
jgi:membrane protein DedA with SNARE-associated domain